MKQVLYRKLKKCLIVGILFFCLSSFVTPVVKCDYYGFPNSNMPSIFSGYGQLENNYALQFGNILQLFSSSGFYGVNSYVNAQIDRYTGMMEWFNPSLKNIDYQKFIFNPNSITPYDLNQTFSGLGGGVSNAYALAGAALGNSWVGMAGVPDISGLFGGSSFFGNSLWSGLSLAEPVSSMSGLNTKAVKCMAQLTGVYKNETWKVSGGFESRYAAFINSYKDFYYTNTDILDLYAEYNGYPTYLMHLDPIYIYCDYELNQRLADIYITRPAYQTLVDALHEINSWTTPPNDFAMLKERYFKRMQLGYLFAELEYDMKLFFFYNPSVLQELEALNAAVTQRLQQIYGSNVIMSWYADWENRYFSAHYSSPEFAQLTQEYNQLIGDFPAVEKYYKLDNDLNTLIQGLVNDVSVKRVSKLVDKVLINQDVSNEIAQHNNNYIVQINELMNTTNLTAEVERFYEKTNGLVLGNETAQFYRDAYLNNKVLLQDFKKKVHDAVYNCYVQYGNWCNPYENPEVINLYSLYTGDIFNWAHDTGSSYAYYNLFFHNFYKSSDYKDLEAEATARVQDTIDTIRPGIKDLQENYSENIGNIPMIKKTREALNDLIFILCNKSSRLYQTITHMAKLSAELIGNNFPAKVITASPVNITSTSAEPRGTVKTYGVPTTVWFIYGKYKGTLTNKSSEQVVNGNKAIGIPIQGLSPNTRYYYRIVTQSNAGISLGERRYFITLNTLSGSTVAVER